MRVTREVGGGLRCLISCEASCGRSWHLLHLPFYRLKCSEELTWRTCRFPLLLAWNRGEAKKAGVKVEGSTLLPSTCLILVTLSFAEAMAIPHPVFCKRQGGEGFREGIFKMLQGKRKGLWAPLRRLLLPSHLASLNDLSGFLGRVILVPPFDHPQGEIEIEHTSALGAIAIVLRAGGVIWVERWVKGGGSSSVGKHEERREENNTSCSCRKHHR